MKRKRKVLKKVKKAVHICYFCNSTKKITKHHIIFRFFLQEQVLEGNIEYLCHNCHDKFHTLIQPMIDLLLNAIKDLEPEPTRKIGFRITNGKGGKSDVFKNLYHQNKAD